MHGAARLRHDRAMQRRNKRAKAGGGHRALAPAAPRARSSLAAANPSAPPATLRGRATRACKIPSTACTTLRACAILPLGIPLIPLNPGESRFRKGSIRESYVFVIDCLERQEVDYGHQGFPGVAFGGARADTRAAARGARGTVGPGARARHRRQRSSLVWTRPGAVRIARAKGRFRAVWRGVCGATSARAAAGPSTR